MRGMRKTNGYGLKRGDVKISALKAIIVALFILSDIAGYGRHFSAANVGTSSTVVSRTCSGYIDALAEVPTDFGPPSPGPTDPNGPFPGP
jgi:hypothetical protein